MMHRVSIVLFAAVAFAAVAHAQQPAAERAPPPPAALPPAAVPPAVKPPAARKPPVAARTEATLPPATGCDSPGAIGVSRSILIDGTTGPRFGHQQYKDIDLLEDGEIVLTFDDGPLRPYTVPVLKALEAHCTKATFFMVGRQALADPDLVRDAAARGHTIGTHTFSHADARKISPAQAKADAELGFSAVARALGQPPAPFFRFPYLSDPSTTATYIRGRQIGLFSIDVDSIDYRTRDAAAVKRNILSGLAAKRKGILLFHDIQPATAGALESLLSELKARGFRVVHLLPASRTTTLAEFDSIAEKESQKPSRGLATRAVTWSAESSPGPAAGGPIGSAGRATPGVEVLPWGTVAVPPPRTTATPAPTPRTGAAPSAAGAAPRTGAPPSAAGAAPATTARPAATAPPAPRPTRPAADDVDWSSQSSRY